MEKKHEVLHAVDELMDGRWRAGRVAARIGVLKHELHSKCSSNIPTRDCPFVVKINSWSNAHDTDSKQTRPLR